MGDAVNLAARIAAKAPPGEIYATAAVLERSPTRVRDARARAVQGEGQGQAGAGLVGRAAGRAAVSTGRRRPLPARRAARPSCRRCAGRSTSAGGARAARRDRRRGRHRQDPADRRGAPARVDGERVLSATAEAFTVTTPYVVWRELLRAGDRCRLGGPRRARARAPLRAWSRAAAPVLEPWLPLLGLALDLDPPMTPEVEALAPEFRAREAARDGDRLPARDAARGRRSAHRGRPPPRRGVGRPAGRARARAAELPGWSSSARREGPRSSRTRRTSVRIELGAARGRRRRWRSPRPRPRRAAARRTC